MPLLRLLIVRKMRTFSFNSKTRPSSAQKESLLTELQVRYQSVCYKNKEHKMRNDCTPQGQARCTNQFVRFYLANFSRQPGFLLPVRMNAINARTKCITMKQITATLDVKSESATPKCTIGGTQIRGRARKMSMTNGRT